MRRRTLLVGLAAPIVAGCIQTSPSFTTENATVDTEPSGVSVEHVYVDPVSDVDLDASVTQTSTERSPCMLRLAVTNTGDSERALRTGPSPPMDPVAGTRREGDAEAFLVPPDGTGYEVPASSADRGVFDTEPPSEGLYPDGPTDGCWQAASDTLQVFNMARGVTLGPGESVARTYALLAHPSNPGCLPPGTYDFTDDARIDGQQITLGVSIHVGPRE